MSDILDALRRAERERRLGQNPTVESLAFNVTPSRAPRKSLGVWLLAGVTLAITATALVVLFVSDREASVAAPPVAAAVAPAPVPQPRPAVTPAPQAEIPAIEDSETIGSLEDLETTEGEAAEDADSAPPPLRSIQLNPEDIAIAPPAEAEASAPPTPAAPPPAPAAPPAPPLLRDMPSAYRSQFPSITLDIHVYDVNPARRWIMVNGQRYKESDALPSGPRIAQITADGVVFDYQSAQVLLPVR